MDVYVHWFLNVRDEQPIKLPRSLPLSDLMVLAYALYRLGETLAAGNVLQERPQPRKIPLPLGQFVNVMVVRLFRRQLEGLIKCRIRPLDPQVRMQ